MAFQLPSRENKKWTQPNNSDLFGILAKTRNVSLDEEGYLKLAPRLRNLVDEGDDADFGHVLGIGYEIGPQRWYFITDKDVFYSDENFQTFTQDVSANVPTSITARADAIQFNGDLHVSADDLQSLNGSTWSSALYSLGGTEGPMALFLNRAELAIGQGDDVILLDTSYSLSETLVLPDDFSVTSLDFARNRMWVGTRAIGDGRAYLFEWDGGSASANDGYPIGSSVITCVKAYGDSVAVLTGEGELLLFNGAGFTPLARLPVYYSDYRYEGAASGATSQPAMHRSMYVEGDLIHINISGELAVSDGNDLEPRMINQFPGGVWTYDPEVGLYHRFSPTDTKHSQTNAVTTANVNTTTDIITVAGATVPATGTPVIYDDGSQGTGTNIPELEFRKRYYVINESSTTMKLATSYANALADTAIDLTGTGNNGQYFIFGPNSDFGSVAGNTAAPSGGIFPYNRVDIARTSGYKLFIGGSSTSSGTSEQDNISILVDEWENRGDAILAKITSARIEEEFQNVTIKWKNMTTEEDAIVVKYRVVERESDLTKLDTAHTNTATWTDSDTFTTTADLSGVETGDEVEFVLGAGAGYLAHIESLSESSGTWTVNIDETIENISASSTALFYIDNWQKLGTINTSDNDLFTTADGDSYNGHTGERTFSIFKKSKQIQIKLELRGNCVAIEDVLVNNTPYREFIAAD